MTSLVGVVEVNLVENVVDQVSHLSLRVKTELQLWVDVGQESETAGHHA